MPRASNTLAYEEAISHQHGRPAGGRCGMKIWIVFGWIHFHRKDQLTVCNRPLLVCHWYRAEWMDSWCDLYSKRLFFIRRPGAREDQKP